MISVIIPLYNKEAIIERTLKSVLSQDYDDFEVVIVDDGSTDNSLEIVERYLEQLKLLNLSNLSNSQSLRSVNIVRQPNGGPSKARNTGVKHAKGEWIVFLDADDEFLPGALSTFSKIADNNKDCNFIVTSFLVKRKDGSEYILSNYKGKVSNPFKEHCLNRIVPHTGSNMYKKELVLNCPFNEKIRRYEDFDVWFRMYRKARMIATKDITFVLNKQYAEASKGRQDISEDFIGYLDFRNKSFWEKMSLYRLFIEERNNYPEECKTLYKDLYYRYDLLLLYKLMLYIRKLK